MLDGLALVVLLTSRDIELVGTFEPIEDFDLTLSGTDEEHVLTQVVLHCYCFLTPIREDFEKF